MRQALNSLLKLPWYWTKLSNAENPTLNLKLPDKSLILLAGTDQWELIKDLQKKKNTNYSKKVTIWEQKHSFTKIQDKFFSALFLV